MTDVNDIPPYIDTPLGDNINMPNEEQMLFDQNGPYNFGLNKNVDVIKEENENNLVTQNNINSEINNNINNNQVEENNVNNVSKQENKEVNKDKKETKENKENKENNNESKVKEKKEISLMHNASKTLSKKEENNANENKDIKQEEKDKEQNKEEQKEKTEEEKNNETKKEVKEVLTEEQKVQKQLKELEEREKKLLEKKSEVLRRYLSENVMPILAKGILSVCENMPDDPVDALANYLLENSFNIEKGKIDDIEIEKVIDNE